MTSTEDIRSKQQDLKNRGLDLGDYIGPEQDTGFGGSLQELRNGNIYWHPSVGAHEVHGGILACYKNVGGPGLLDQPRLLGFPITDEELTADGIAVSYFEWGAIYWFWGGVILHGDIYHRWKTQNSDNQGRPMPAGYPIDNQQDLAGGQAVFFEHGCWWKGPASNDSLLSFSVSTPSIGRPAIWNSDDTATTPLPIQIRCDASFDTMTALRRNNRGDLFSEIWQGRLLLQRVVAEGQPPEEIAVQCAQTSNVEEAGGEVFGSIRPVTCQLPPGRKLIDRALYNIVYRNPDSGRTYPLAPHAIYAKASWDNFGLMHATDMHVSRRLETFRALLQQADYPDGAALYNCFNDNFREVIQYANHLYDIGTLDLILATGDLVDYVFENGDNTNGAGNFDFFRRLVLGNAPSSQPGIPNEELRVPIFTVPGNHDYRKYPYMLYFEPTAQHRYLRPVVSLVGGASPIQSNGSHNLTRLEALAVDNGGTRRTETPVVAGGLAALMVEVDERCRAYFENHCCPVKSGRESVGWHFRRNWRFGRWPEVRIEWAFSRKA